MNIFRRLYVTSVSWENVQTILQKGNVFKVNGFSKDAINYFTTT